MKTPKPQPVTFDYRNYRVTAINEAQTKFYPLYDIVLYGGPVAHLSEYELSQPRPTAWPDPSTISQRTRATSPRALACRH